LHTLVINGAECEPYLTCDDRIIREYSANVIDGIRIMAYAPGVENIVIGIENNKPEAQAAMREAATAFPNIQVVGLPMCYPMGTVSGGAIQQPRNLRVLLGTKVQDVIDYCQGFREEPTRLISGGPMMGNVLPLRVVAAGDGSHQPVSDHHHGCILSPAPNN
jgi:electron transport complex protein RnfC